MSTQILPNDLYLVKARQSIDSKDCMTIYDKWAATYNDEVGHKDQGYVGPTLVAQVAVSSTTEPAKSVSLDAGCGTGLVGQAMAMLGAKVIDGLDLSPAMLKVAEQTGVYRNLNKADLTEPIEKPDNTYDIITCVGTFTLGHVGPDPALKEFVRITKPNGIIVATIIEELWIKGGFKTEVERLSATGQVAVVASELVDYVKGHGDKAILLVLEKVDSAKAT